MDRFHFPPWVNTFTLLVIGGVLAGGAYAGGLLFFGTLPEVMYVGYQPTQPVPFSHKLHAGELKMDCRYCHYTVDQAAHAAVPATSTCGNCHNAQKTPDGALAKTVVHPDSPKLQPIRNSLATGEPVLWEKIHDLADYVYFNHAAHVNKGVGCVECHGRIDRMEVVHKAESLAMSWCLDCHRNPEPHLRPLDQITNMDWDPEETSEQSREEIGRLVREQLDVHPNTNCTTCHR
ncbi:cytochrome c3 family protein [Botrimarina sp.]|uniref:cytochrome c3 family protein n=1 Tax=Botrimarina sp. TaxID=2795802 RepID=UPI0032EAB5D9